MLYDYDTVHNRQKLTKLETVLQAYKRIKFRTKLANDNNIAINEGASELKPDATEVGTRFRYRTYCNRRTANVPAILPSFLLDPMPTTKEQHSILPAKFDGTFQPITVSLYNHVMLN